MSTIIQANNTAHAKSDLWNERCKGKWCVFIPGSLIGDKDLIRPLILTQDEIKIAFLSTQQTSIYDSEDSDIYSANCNWLAAEDLMSTKKNFAQLDFYFDFEDVSKLVTTDSLMSGMLQYPMIKSGEQYNRIVDSTGEDLTPVRQFRTYIAKYLHELNITTWKDVPAGMEDLAIAQKYLMVLEYYMNHMYDETVKKLSLINADYQIPSVVTPGCGCGNNNLSGLALESGSVCNALAIYRKYIYQQMVTMFSSIDFWQRVPGPTIELFLIWLQKIIDLNIPLGQAQYVSTLVDCSCVGNTLQDSNVAILNRLKKAWTYIKDGEIDSHKNFIFKALNDWATNLYEVMEWTSI